MPAHWTTCRRPKVRTTCRQHLRHAATPLIRSNLTGLVHPMVTPQNAPTVRDPASMRGRPRRRRHAVAYSTTPHSDLRQIRMLDRNTFCPSPHLEQMAPPVTFEARPCIIHRLNLDVCTEPHSLPSAFPKAPHRPAQNFRRFTESSRQMNCCPPQISAAGYS